MPAQTEATTDPKSASAPAWSIYEIAALDDPYDDWRRLRERDALAPADDGVWVATSWSAADAILKDPRFGAGRGVAASFGADAGGAADVMSTWLMSHDGPPHDRARALVRRSFTPRAVDAIAPMIREVVSECATSVRADLDSEPIDLVARFAFAIPSEVMRRLFGFERELWRALEAQVRDLPDTPGASLAMISGLAEGFEAALRATPEDGLLAALARPDEAGECLGSEEVVANAVLLLTAGIDTTTGLIVNAVHCLLDHPELAARVATEDGFSAKAVEETLRFEAPAISCSRRAFEDAVIADRTIPKDAQVLVGLAAANRDPERFPDPNVFDPDRDLTGVLAFGGGRHHCLGAPLARLEGLLALEAIFAAGFPSLERVEGVTWQRRNPTVRSLERLFVRRSEDQ